MKIFLQKTKKFFFFLVCFLQNRDRIHLQSQIKPMNISGDNGGIFGGLLKIKENKVEEMGRKKKRKFLQYFKKTNPLVSWIAHFIGETPRNFFKKNYGSPFETFLS